VAEPHGQLMRYKKRRRRPSLFLRLRGGRRPGGEQVLRLRARDGAFRAPARVTFFFCKKKVTKENHSNLRFKNPLARGGFRRCGGESVLHLRARDGAFRAPARVPFFFCKKKGTKENHLDLRSKDPLARGRFRRCGGEQVLRLRAQAAFFSCRKKAAKERHLRKGGFRISPFP